MRAALLLLLCGLAAGAELAVRIRPATTVAGPRATLADVAELAGEAAALARVADLTVAELSGLAPVRIDARLVTAIATRAAAPAILAVSGEGTAARAARTWSEAEILAVATTAVAPGARCTPVRASGAITAPAEAVLVAEPLDPLAVGEVPFRVRAMADGREHARALAVVRVEREAEVVVAARDLARGEAIGPADLRIERRAVVRQVPPPADPAALVGGILRNAVAAGAPVTPALVQSRPAVRAGTVVTALWPGRGFSVELQATAVSDARIGERVGLRRAGERGLLTGVVQPDGTVVVQP